MDYRSEYENKKITAAQAAELIHSGDWVDYGWCSGTPHDIDIEVAKRLPKLEDVKFRGGILLTRPAIFDVENAAEHMTWNSWHMTGVERATVKAGFGFYAPVRYSELPRYYRENVEPGDVAYLVVSPMDNFGYFSFGPSASHLADLCDKAKKVVVEVNENMPRCLGGFRTGIHISQVDYIVESTNTPIPELPSGGATDVDQKVAELIVNEIPDGACLQLGIGGMPNAVGSLIARSDLKHLGVHTEMYVDAYVDMAKAGKIDGMNKSLDKGRQVYAFGAGTKKLYDYLNDNPECMSAPVDYTNDVRVIAQLDNFISINNTVDVDLYGQVSAESSGTRQISGAGGQQDFVMGAYLSKGGKSFICCSSTYTNHQGETFSRIVPTLKPGSAVTDTRPNTHYVVTEYGLVNLKGLNTWQRAEALISIAHPDFRQQLVEQAEKMQIWKTHNNHFEF
ncbi:MAG: butyryl-CoA:acetate CoA-transferase [Catenisphaera adipataccumulans]|jgi:butyryl-CoA:acetate CoA-transferase|uniref:butyryl-CoA:acetate CoA-transferase n=1 Tax=Catenisphaera adipataccumulans TaxID=700500 RepID=UPI003D8DE43E